MNSTVCHIPIYVLQVIPGARALRPYPRVKGKVNASIKQEVDNMAESTTTRSETPPTPSVDTKNDSLPRRRPAPSAPGGKRSLTDQSSKQPRHMTTVRYCFIPLSHSPTHSLIYLLTLSPSPSLPPSLLSLSQSIEPCSTIQ